MARKVTKLDLSPLRAQLRTMAAQAPAVRRAALRETAEALNSEAQVESPVLTGDLKASHIVDASNPDAVALGATVSYAAAVHTRHPTKPQWYLRAILANGQRVLGAALRRALAKEGTP